jgi:hypothetical protein
MLFLTLLTGAVAVRAQNIPITWQGYSNSENLHVDNFLYSFSNSNQSYFFAPKRAYGHGGCAIHGGTYACVEGVVFFLREERFQEI